MSKISRFIFGAYTLAVPSEQAPRAMNVLITNNIPFGKSREEGGGVLILLSRRGLRRYLDVTGGFLFGERAFCHGLPELFRRYRLRAGVFAGLLIFIASVTLSSFFIWDVNVTGNVSITAEEMQERLAAYGVREGAFIPALDMNDIASRILLEAGNISFLKINVHGTVARVADRTARGNGRLLQGAIPHSREKGRASRFGNYRFRTSRLPPCALSREGFCARNTQLRERNPPGNHRKSLHRGGKEQKKYNFFRKIA